jgi:hypothetical protein
VKIKILPSALADLDRGRIFYARQSKGIGDYFLDSLLTVRRNAQMPLQPFVPT